MKRNKKNSFFSLLLGLLGLSATSCIIPIPSMYGSPNAQWSVKGRVIDEDGRGVPGLQVALGNQIENEPGIIYDQNYWPLDTLRTDTDGVYQVHSGGFPLSNLQIDVKDVDGEANGGDFADVSLLVREIEFEGGKGWYEGNAEINVPDIIIKKK